MKVGILGVGHLAGYLVSGLRVLGFAEAIHLSPRNRETAARLAEAQDCRLCSDNQAVVEAAEVIFLTVPAKDAASVLTSLAFRPEQLVISACAGQGFSQLAGKCAPASLATAMPVSAAAVGRSPTLLYPGDARAEALLEPLGPVMVMESEAKFRAASANAAVYVWIIDLIDQLTACNEAAGLDAGEARRLVSLMTEAAAAVAGSDPARPLPEMIRGLTSKGGITECGFQVLRGADANTPWREAFEAVLAHLEGR